MDKIINGKIYSDLSAHFEADYQSNFVRCTKIFEIISHKGKLYYRPLTSEELEQ